MHIISKSKLVSFWRIHPETQNALNEWFHEAQIAKWTNPQDIKNQYDQASILANNRVCFNIGRQYRMIVWVQYQYGKVFVRFIGTHSEYDALKDAGSV